MTTRYRSEGNSYLPYSQRGPRTATATFTLRRLEVGEHRRIGDWWLSYGETLEPVDPEWISRWFPWLNRVTSQHCPHYRVSRVGPMTDLESKRKADIAALLGLGPERHTTPHSHD